MHKLKEYIDKNYKKVIGWGTSKYYEDCSKELDISLDYLIDSDESKVGKLLDGKRVYSSSILEKEDMNETLIVIFSSFYQEICEAIKKYGDFYTISGKQLLTLSRSFEARKDSILDENEKEKNIILTISRNNFALYIGGTSKFIREQMNLFIENNFLTIHIFWEEYNLKGLEGFYINIVKNGIEKGVFLVNDVFDIVKNIKAVIIHNLIDMKLAKLDIILNHIDSKTSIIYYIHDFSCICKNIKLMYNDKVFCNGYEDNWSKCQTCVYGEEKNRIYNYHKKLFNRREMQIIAPSNSTKEIIDKAFCFNNDKVKVISHQKYDLAKKEYIFVNEKVKIAYVGYKHIHKGWELFKKMVIEFKDKYNFYCFGSSDEILEGVEYVDVSFIDDGPMAMTNKLTEYGIDVSLLLSIWPETYSYTYYESSAAGTFVITSALSGNIYDQVIKNKNGIAINNYEELKQMLSDEDKFKSLIQKNNFIIKNVRNNNEEILNLIDKSSYK